MNIKKGWIILAVVVLLVLLVIGGFSSRYNALVTEYENIDAKWSQVESALQLRADLIPNLVATVKGYAAHEEQIFTAIAEARSKLIGATGVDETAQARGELEGALSRLLAISEAYPILKADQSFIALQDSLEGTEYRIRVARMDYNTAVQTYNTMRKRFPTNIYAAVFGYEARAYFEADEGARTVPQVQF